MYLGIPSVVRDPYGVEYRVLSGAMMKDVETLNFVWDQLSKAIYHCSRGSSLIRPDITCSIINDSNLELAKRVISEYNIIQKIGR